VTHFCQLAYPFSIFEGLCPEEYCRTVIIGKEDFDELTGWN